MEEIIQAVETNDSEVTAPIDEQPIQEEQKPVEEQKQPQSKEMNSQFARERREREMNEKIAKERSEARTQAIIEAIGENPYTHKPLEDAKDVEAYLIMKQIDKDGGDPLGDYPEYQKKADKKQEETRAAEKTAEDNRINDIKDFVEKYPTVDLEALGNDADFEEYCGDRLGKVPLATLYKSYQSLLGRLGAKQTQDAKNKEVIEKAKTNAVVGSLESVQQAEVLYSLEELKSMSMEEINKNWDKVQRSRKKLNI